MIPDDIRIADLLQCRADCASWHRRIPEYDPALGWSANIRRQHLQGVLDAPMRAHDAGDEDCDADALQRQPGPAP
jgi:hypothetical protein